MSDQVSPMLEACVAERMASFRYRLFVGYLCAAKLRSTRYDDLRAFYRIVGMTKISDVDERATCPLQQNEIRRCRGWVTRVENK